MGLRLFEPPEIQVERRITGYENAVLRAERIGLRMGDHQILHDVSLGMTPGEITAITGSNGAGKTSLLRVMAGLQKEIAGAVYLGGTMARRKKRIRNTFFVQQDVDYQLYTPSVQEEILMGSKLPRDDRRVADTVEMLGLAELLSHHPNTLSGGQKQRVLIAAAILRDAPTLMLDEPTSGLDGYHMRTTSEILKGMAARGKATALVTHDLEFIGNVADTLAYMNKSEMKYHHKLKGGSTP